MNHESLMCMSREELNDLAMKTRDPATLSEETIARMKELKVGPFAYEWTKEKPRYEGYPKARRRESST